MSVWVSLIFSKNTCIKRNSLYYRALVRKIRQNNAQKRRKSRNGYKMSVYPYKMWYYNAKKLISPFKINEKNNKGKGNGWNQRETGILVYYKDCQRKE